MLNAHFYDRRASEYISVKVLKDQWLDNVRRVPSNNCNQRPVGAEISLLVLHNISLPAGTFGNRCIEELFTNCLDCHAHPDFSDLEGVEVSAHLLIDRLGEVTQFVPFNLRAWHAGLSHYQGCDNCNDFSIGIELEGVDDKPYTTEQYRSLTDVSLRIMQLLPSITVDTIVGHCDISPGRKTDPGPAFDWKAYLHSLSV
ncbi:MAG: AmpD protein [Oceanicoccus sp.]|jgi:AmpD protein